MACQKADYDDIDCVDIILSFGDDAIIPFEVEDGEAISDTNFRVVVKPSYSSSRKETFSLSEGNVVKDVVGTDVTYNVNFNTLGEFRDYERLVYDLYGHEDQPLTRIAKGRIIINKSTL